MDNAKNTIRRQSVFLFWEFVVIVLGVLAALAVDQWRSELEINEQRYHILESLLTDLQEDREDFLHFVQNAQERAIAAEYLDSLANGVVAKLPGQFESPGEAIRFLGITALLNPTRSAIDEMGSTGTRSVIKEPQLRTQILQYYALANDRTAINGFIEPELQRYRAALERLGVSYADGGKIDAETVMKNKTVHAIVRSMSSIAEFAPYYCEELIQINAELIAEIEQTLTAR